MTQSRAQAYRDCLDSWINDLRSIYPHVREGVPRTIVHAAGHIFQFLVSYGPVNSWWCFPYERLIGSLQKINTNNHIGGMAESTMMKTIARTANIRRWLRRPDCPTAIKQLKVLFDKSFVPANATIESEPLREIKGSRRAYAKHDGHNFSGFKTHEGNASIIYRPASTDSPRAGQIQWIENIKTSDGDAALLHVRPYQPLRKAVYDPFVRYPHLDVKTYSSTLSDTEHIIQLDDVVAHAARFDYSQGRSVFLNLARD
ncbi:hypothetical protein E1B28_007547 [Marasmius oreades]|uniref:Uncharacterized protein n=1 Tax=Marasmius oreades TaxID=181124 RepID=A0A9P7S1V1_9AGAR|nr:uncharacterized protein E1B28_007547 [Marasmius oreades]KAG7093911.1 hypothetical protein E1B28_007547 [Marasmius oreades]